jgi:FSR family fosmidomycin resistance protein-like MFS transporter
MHPHLPFNRPKVLLLTAGHLVTDIYPGLLSPLLPALQITLGLSLPKTAFIASSLVIISSLSQLVFGYLSDLTQKTVLVASGPVIGAVFLSSLGFADSYWMLILFVSLGALGVAAFHPQGAALIGIKSGDRPFAGMSLFVTGGALGVSLGALIAGPIVELGSMRTLSYLMILGICIGFLLWKYISRDILTRHHQKGASGDGKAHWVVLVSMIILAMARAYIFVSLSTFIPLYLAEKGHTLSFGGLTLFFLHTAAGIGGFSGGFWAEKLGAPKVVLISFLVPVPLFMLYVFAESSVGIVFLALAAYMLFTSTPLVISLGQRAYPKNIAMASSMVMGFAWGSAGVLVTPTGVLADHIGLFHTLLSISFTPFVGFLLTLLIFRKMDL